MQNRSFKPRLEVLEDRLTPANLFGQVQTMFNHEVQAIGQQIQAAAQALSSVDLTDLGNGLSTLSLGANWLANSNLLKDYVGLGIGPAGANSFVFGSSSQIQQWSQEVSGLLNSTSLKGG